MVPMLLELMMHAWILLATTRIKNGNIQGLTIRFWVIMTMEGKCCTLTYETFMSIPCATIRILGFNEINRILENGNVSFYFIKIRKFIHIPQTVFEETSNVLNPNI